MLSIPASATDTGLELKVLQILEEIEVPIDTSLVEDCHCLPSKGWPKKDIICRILLNKSKLKNLKPESVNLPGEANVFINESLCLYCKKLWSKCKKLRGADQISAVWVSKRLLRIKLSNESVSIITHDCYLKKLFLGNPLVEDN